MGERSLNELDRDERIVLLKAFGNPIEASLAKSKLDAFGIPCFLTGENMANLYPGERIIPFEVRLFVFEADRQQAIETLEQMEDTPGDVVCPRCRSTRVERRPSKRPFITWLRILAALIVAVPVPAKTVYWCRDCHTEF